MSSKIEQEKQVKLLKIGFKEKKRKQFTQSLNDAAADKLPKYCADYNFNPPRGAGFMPAITSTSGRLHSEFIRILFLQTHRETDRSFTPSGVLSG
jgi:hypothetical protein